ncbi:MAG: cysteine desulfurase [Proteobacteria bacterium]|nr:cysteine desulfurase [Pseudomonadota bacterium]
MTVYLDYNATTPLLPEVVDAMMPFLRERFGNPSSGHPFGRDAREAVDAARGEVAALLGCAPEEIVFTSGGTEANNLAIRGIAAARHGAGRIVTSVVEHPAIAAPCAALERQGWTVERLPVDAQGRVPADVAAAALGADTALVTIMHANNETGTVQPIAEIAAAAEARGALVHTDAAQSAGKLPVDVRALGVDLLSIAGHKLYAPKGVGALYVRRGTAMEPFLRGAGQESGLRPGTENVAGIAGLGAAAAAAQRDLAALAARLSSLTTRLWDALARGVPGIALNGHPVARLPNTLNVRFPGVRGGALLAAAPEIAASTGAACHAGGEEASVAITAMGVPAEAALGSVRLSIGRGTTEADVDLAAAALSRAWRELSDGRTGK